MEGDVDGRAVQRRGHPHRRLPDRPLRPPDGGPGRLIRDAVRVGVPRGDAERPVELLGEHHPRELVGHRQRARATGARRTRPAARRAIADRAADHEGHRAGRACGAPARRRRPRSRPARGRRGRAPRVAARGSRRARRRSASAARARSSPRWSGSAATSSTRRPDQPVDPLLVEPPRARRGAGAAGPRRRSGAAASGVPAQRSTVAVAQRQRDALERARVGAEPEPDRGGRVGDAQAALDQALVQADVGRRDRARPQRRASRPRARRRG